MTREVQPCTICVRQNEAWKKKLGEKEFGQRRIRAWLWAVFNPQPPLRPGNYCDPCPLCGAYLCWRHGAGTRFQPSHSFRCWVERQEKSQRLEINDYA